jgi:SAM-dependent methyltransferase
MLTIPEHDIRRHGPGRFLAVCWRQWRVERALARRGVRFRSTDPKALEAAYAAMTEQEFDAINGPQDWANWRTIPRSLGGHVPDRPLRALDLGCGTGGSTRVLAFYCPLGSTITGYELARPLLEIARRRTYPHRGGRPADVNFCCQGVTEPLREPAGGPVPDRGVDLVNASGVVGHHLNRDTAAPLVRELRRVLAPGGIAALDVGPTLRAPDLIGLMRAAGFQALGRCRSCLLDPTGQVVFRAAEAGSRPA